MPFTVPLPELVSSQSNLAFARNEKQRTNETARLLLDYLKRSDDIRKHHNRPLTAAEAKAYAAFFESFDRITEFRRAEFTFTPNNQTPPSVITAKHAAWESAARCVLTGIEHSNLDERIERIDMIWRAATELGGVADWPRYLQAARNALDTSHLPDRTKAGIRSHTYNLEALNRTITGETVPLAGYQPVEANREVSERYIQSILMPAVNATRASVAQGKSESTLTTYDLDSQLQVRYQHIDAVAKLADAWISELSHKVRKSNSQPRQAIWTKDDTNPSNDSRPVVTVVVGHEDDFNSKFAATTQTLQNDGYRVLVIVATDGSGGEPQNPEFDNVKYHREFMDIRLEETLKAMETSGVDDVVFLGYGDSGMSGNPSAHDFRLADVYRMDHSRVENELTDIITRYNSHLVLTHQTIAEQMGNYPHPDHLTVVKALTAVARQLNHHNYDVSLYSVSLPHEELAYAYRGIFQQEPPDGLNLAPSARPTTVINTPPQAVDAATNALNQYSSQVTPSIETFVVGRPGKSHFTRIFPPYVGSDIETSFRDSTQDATRCSRARQDIQSASAFNKENANSPVVVFLAARQANTQANLTSRDHLMQSYLKHLGYECIEVQTSDVIQFQNTIDEIKARTNRPLVVVDNSDQLISLRSRIEPEAFILPEPGAGNVATKKAFKLFAKTTAPVHVITGTNSPTREASAALARAAGPNGSLLTIDRADGNLRVGSNDTSYFEAAAAVASVVNAVGNSLDAEKFAPRKAPMVLEASLG